MPKMLVKKLRALGHHALTERRFYAGTPPRVEYRLSASDRSLEYPLAVLLEWSVGQEKQIYEASTTGDEMRADSVVRVSIP
ncbi:MAG: winged helix-turn-helix transcriptional regulator [Salinicola sp.]|nr:winged helix-turn-helix transcriptional regulator [Salinicola sp.]